MKKIKILIMLNTAAFMMTVFTVAAQSTSDAADMTNKETSSITGAVIGGAAVIALIAVLILMIRNRRKTIGGIQSQSKAEPTPVTTQSIDNPGSGV